VAEEVTSLAATTIRAMALMKKESSRHLKYPSVVVLPRSAWTGRRHGGRFLRLSLSTSTPGAV